MQFGIHLPHFGPLVSGQGTLALAQQAGLQHVVLSPFYGVSKDQQPEDIDAVGRLLEQFMNEVVPALSRS